MNEQIIELVQLPVIDERLQAYNAYKAARMAEEKAKKKTANE